MSDHPRLLTIAAAADQLDLNPETIRRAIRAGRLACYRLGGCTRIAPEQLAAYLESSLCPARETKSLTLSPEEGSGQSSGGKTDSVDEFRRERTMNRALN